MSIVKDFALPDLGEGLTESELVAWRVAVGDEVELNQVIAEVETAKALVELPSPFAGRISKLYAEPGSTVMVGAPIVEFALEEGADTGAGGEPGPAAEPVQPEPAPAPVPMDAVAGGSVTGSEPATQPAAPQRQSVLVGYGPLADDGSRPKRRPRPGLARLGTARLQASQPEAASSQEESPASTMTEPGETRRPIQGVRKRTAEAMVASAFTAPHVTEFLTVDVTPTMELIASLKQEPAYAEHRIGMLALVSKALCLTVPRTPSVNSRWDEEHQEIIEYGHVNLGIAVATQRGLIVPNIKGAERLNLVELASALAELTETARSGAASPAQLSGGTISISNVGVFGVDAGTPILNPGEAAILAIGAVRRMPWEHRGEVALRQVATLSLSFDHRLVDGEQGSRFLKDIGTILADPARVLTMV